MLTFVAGRPPLRHPHWFGGFCLPRFGKSRRREVGHTIRILPCDRPGVHHHEPLPCVRRHTRIASATSCPADRPCLEKVCHGLATRGGCPRFSFALIRGTMKLVRPPGTASLRGPNLDATVMQCGGERLAAWIEGQAVDEMLGGQDQKLLAGEHIPEPDGLAFAAGRQGFAVG